MNKILLIDDSSDFIAMVSDTLKDLYKDSLIIYSALNLSDALSILTREHIDLVISDLSVATNERQNDLSLLSSLTEDYPLSIFVICSGYDSKEIIEECLKLGVKDYLVKPIKVDDVSLCIEKHLIISEMAS